MTKLQSLAVGWLLVGVSALAQSSPPATYIEFMKLAPELRRKAWITATPQLKSELAQSHARTWLKQTEQRLSAHQIEVVTDVISMLTPDLYIAPESDAAISKKKQVVQRLSCVLWKSDIAAAFKPASPPIKGSWSDDVWGWVNGCFLGR